MAVTRSSTAMVMASSRKEHNISYTRERVASQIYALNNYAFLAVNGNTYGIYSAYIIYQKNGAVTRIYEVLETLKLNMLLDSYVDFSEGQLNANGL